MHSNQLSPLFRLHLLLGIIWDIYSLLGLFNVAMPIIMMLLLRFAINFGLEVIGNALGLSTCPGWIMRLLIPVMMLILLCFQIEIWEKQSTQILLQCWHTHQLGQVAGNYGY